MSKPPAYTATNETITVMTPGAAPGALLPWAAGEEGRRHFVKLTRASETGLLDAGATGSQPAELHPLVMRLLNEGWTVEGQVDLHFLGSPDPDAGLLVEWDALTLELGVHLLALVDSARGAILLGRLSAIRRVVARDLGVPVPGVRIRDNLSLGKDQYLLRVRQGPVAVGEVFLDRALAVGPREELDRLQGWAAQDPTYRMPAKWIELSQAAAIKDGKVAVIPAIEVLQTHLQHSVMASAAELLGLQETATLLEALAATHPVVTAEFLEDRRRLRAVHRILRQLLGEGVPITDLVTILETLGERLQDLEKLDLAVEFVRMALARLICWSRMGEDGVLRALVLADGLQARLLRALGAPGEAPSFTAQDADALLDAVRIALDGRMNPLVLLTPPPLRLPVRRILERPYPRLSVLSTLEIAPGVRLEPAGTVGGPVIQEKGPGRRKP